MLIRSTLAIAALSFPLFAQTDAKPAKADHGASAAFFKAYYIDNEMASSKEATAKAIGLYQDFLAKNAGHKLAPKAAFRLVVLHYATGKFDAARALAKTHAGLLAKNREASRAARGNRQQGGNDVRRELWGMMREAGENERAAIMAAMTRGMGSRGMRGMGRRGGQGGQRGGRFGGRRTQLPQIANMKPDEAKKAVEGIATTVERMIDAMAQRGQSDQADALEKKLDKLLDLVDDGKLKEAQAMIDEFGRSMQGNRGRRRGGEGGNRRRGGGQEGGNGRIK